MKSKLILVCSIALGLMACEGRKESPVFAYTSVENFSTNSDKLQGDTYCQLYTEARSTTSTVRRITITSFDEVYLNQTVLDTVFQDPLKEIKMHTLYHTNVFEDTTLVTFTTTAYATDGETSSLSLRVWVAPTEQKLRPIDDVTLYSALSGQSSYFSLETMTAVLADTTMKGLYFRDVAPTDSSDVMSRSWTSPNVYFARFESFDYSEATKTSIVSAYKSCKCDHTILALRNDDVILFGTENKALGAIKIIYIGDGEGNKDDRYVFSIKALSN
ncbi:MAG: hypothetical protein MJZ65_02010 [Paludibacteraceae bacterium]|nr:hypothetical protein [Paludibacteraceae bacterium]